MGFQPMAFVRRVHSVRFLRRLEASGPSYRSPILFAQVMVLRSRQV